MAVVTEIPRTGSADLEVAGRRIALSGLERPMWPVAGLTKADLLAYYARVAPILLPHVRDRPLRVVRFPGGVHRRGVVDSELPDAPPWIRRDAGSPIVEDEASLLWVVEQATVELHVPLGGGAERPAAILFDVEAGPGRGLVDCCSAAVKLRGALTADGLSAHVKTSGAFGLHVAVPLNGGADGAQARAYAHAVAERLSRQDGELITSDARRASRASRVLVDWRPNAPRRWAVAPYSLRAMLPGPGVSAPVGWDDVQVGAEGELEALHRAPDDVLAHAEREGDPWRAVLETVQRLPGPG